jgi:hypothetical protein
MAASLVTVTQNRTTVTVQSARLGNLALARSAPISGETHTHDQTPTATAPADTDLVLARSAAGTYLRYAWSTLKTALGLLFAAKAHKAQHAAGGADALTHADIGSRTATDSHPETAISSAYTEIVVAAGAATLTVPTGVSYLRASLDCDGGAVDFDVSGFTVATVADVVITDGGSITWPVAWLWQTDDGDAPTPPTTGIIHIHLEGKPDAAGTGVQIWAWNLGERDDA